MDKLFFLKKKIRNKNVWFWFGSNSFKSYLIHLQTSKDFFKAEIFQH